MEGNGRRFVSYPVLWAVATAVTVATFICISTLFNWHKETPHAGSLTVQGFINRVEVISLRLDRLEDEINELNGGD